MEAGLAPTAGDEPEEALVERARALDADAWKAIYERHAGQVYAYVYYRLGDQHTAEDLCAEVFARAVVGIKRYTYRGTPLLAWLYRIAHNVTVDHRQAAARHNARTVPGGLDGAEAPVETFGALDERNDMLAAIQQLTPDQQQVVILRFYHGMSSAEVARIVDKPEGAVKALQARAVRALRRIIERDEPRRATA